MPDYAREVSGQVEDARKTPVALLGALRDSVGHRKLNVNCNTKQSKSRAVRLDVRQNVKALFAFLEGHAVGLAPRVNFVLATR